MWGKEAVTDSHNQGATSELLLPDELTGAVGVCRRCVAY